MRVPQVILIRTGYAYNTAERLENNRYKRCPHGMVKSKCRFCTTCVHGHKLLKLKCPYCNPCQHRHSWRKCLECRDRFALAIRIIPK